jgi:hypothetical protein
VFAFDFDFHAPTMVGDESAQVQPGRQAVNERPEADALHDAADVDGATLQSRR